MFRTALKDTEFQDVLIEPLLYVIGLTSGILLARSTIVLPSPITVRKAS